MGQSKKNEVQNEINDIGYGVCGFAHEHGKYLPFIPHPLTYTVLEEYRGCTIRMYTGGRYVIGSSWSDFLLLDNGCFWWGDNNNIIVTRSIPENNSDTYFAMIRPKRHWLFWWRRDYTTCWMSSEYAVQKVKEAVAQFKKDIDNYYLKIEQDKLATQRKLQCDTKCAEKLIEGVLH
jgi:hypothetical protein